MDSYNEYTSQTITLKPDYEGEVTATLISSNANAGNRKSVLYVHGFIDYFFHGHMGKEFNANEFDFYALDLRKYGRSLMEHQHPNYCKSIEEYYEELTLAIRQIHETSNGEVILLAHSTGGLITSNYMNYGEEKDLVKALVLNSPFFDFNMSAIEKAAALTVSKPIGGLFKYSKIEGALSPAYAESIHKDYYGEWSFNLDWKPIEGFPTYFKWIGAIRKGHKNLKKSDIKSPVLVMHSSSSERISKYSEKATHQDIVLDIEDIKRVGEKLGSQVTLLEIEDGLHDLFLSKEPVRNKAFQEMFDWLNKLESSE
ncbi:alpha/beta hydrolase [Brumimicrobium oceani]|uniref:Alpha/beta hydrolase n=1 Tax=Brumimicrobium oceani TaxID=2100725 RepID=A0A2U2XHH4_9FLAO|nr:alpha/beta hydrolase [Brumimicrobium oceani]PWH87248.1 alpha/beta hydrolase [Brumimicrobium oceani]